MIVPEKINAKQASLDEFHVQLKELVQEYTQKQGLPDESDGK
jgi:hypothetical protein